MKKIIIAAVLIGVILGTICAVSIPATSQTWTPNKSVIKAHKDSVKTDKKAFQCWGTTQKGERCKRKVNTSGDYCYQHTSQKK